SKLFNSSSVPEELLANLHHYLLGLELNLSNLVLCSAINGDIIQHDDATVDDLYGNMSSAESVTTAHSSGTDFFHLGHSGCSRFIHTVRSGVGLYPEAVRRHVFELFKPFVAYLQKGKYTVSSDAVQHLAVNNYHQKRLRNFVVKLAEAYGKTFDHLTWLDQWKSYEEHWFSGRGARLQDISCFSLCISPLGYLANFSSHTLGVHTMGFNTEAGTFALLTFMKRFGVDITRPTTMKSITAIYDMSFITRGKQVEHPLSFIARVRKAADRLAPSVVTLDPGEMLSPKILAQVVMEALRVLYGSLDHIDQTFLQKLYALDSERRVQGDPITLDELTKRFTEAQNTHFQITDSSEGSPSTYIWIRDNDQEAIDSDTKFSNLVSGRSDASRPSASSSKQANKGDGSKGGKGNKGSGKSGSQNPSKADTSKKNTANRSTEVTAWRKLGRQVAYLIHQHSPSDLRTALVLLRPDGHTKVEPNSVLFVKSKAGLSDTALSAICRCCPDFSNLWDQFKNGNNVKTAKFKNELVDKIWPLLITNDFFSEPEAQVNLAQPPPPQPPPPTGYWGPPGQPGHFQQQQPGLSPSPSAGVYGASVGGYQYPQHQQFGGPQNQQSTAYYDQLSSSGSASFPNGQMHGGVSPSMQHNPHNSNSPYHHNSGAGPPGFSPSSQGSVSHPGNAYFNQPSHMRTAGQAAHQILGQAAHQPPYLQQQQYSSDVSSGLSDGVGSEASDSFNGDPRSHFPSSGYK
ncbi:MAG: hypothetical protein CMQ16_01450, partial [Gammaproteobacteria bacterium]|nr:hypothetical protein [Gammaproteobacteria bacterium]